jgi:hypothetical protein
MKTTRNEDLDLLDYARSLMNTDHGVKRMNTNLAVAHFMSKDRVLEKARHELIDALKRGDIKKIHALERKVKRYANTDDYRKRLADHVKRNTGLDEANSIFFKGSI